MKKFIVTKTQPTVNVWTYYVEAESEEEAISKVENNEVEYDDFTTEDHWYTDDYNFDVEEDD